MATDTDPAADSAATEKLRAAIDAYRKECGDDADCQHVIAALDRAERELELAGKPSTRDTPVADQPKTLKGAAEVARQAFAQRRASSTK